MKLREWFYFKKSGITCKIRAAKKHYFFGRTDIIIGKNVIIRKGSGHHVFGAKNVILDNCIFEMHDENASLTTGSDCFFAFGVVTVCSQNIELGNHVWIGEYSSLRDATHSFSADHVLGSMPDKIEPIKIGNNVWIGRGCLIMPGTTIGDNVIIAANSVVKGRCESNSIYGGTPAVFIKMVDGAPGKSA